jgi:cytochrome b561
MSLKNTATSYGSTTKFFHWTVALCVIALLIVGFMMDDIQNKALKMQVYNLHKLLGLTVLILMLSRLVWRLLNIQPGYPASVPRWEQRAARSVHDLLYLTLIIMPLSGWIMSTAAGHPPYLGSYLIKAPFISVSQSTAQFFNNLHSAFAWIIPGLISIHIAAAIKHHLIDKNNVLLRMLPWVKSTTQNRS